MTLNPRDYQIEASEKTLDAFERCRCVLGVAATGLGKTFMAAMIARPFKEKGRIMFVAHQDKLIDQARNTFEGVLDCPSQVEMGEKWADRKVYGEQILFTSPQTQLAGREGGRMTRFDPNEFSLLVVDEVHHHLSPEWLRVINYYLQNPNLKVFGITATPKRSDKRAMGQLFQHVAFNYDILWGIDNGWLVPLHQYPVYVKDLDLSGVRVTAGELNGAELAVKLEDKQIVYEMATPVLRETGDDKTLIFTKTVDQARFFANVLNAEKPGSAEYVAGTTPREYRKPLFERYARGEFQYLVSVNVPREGFDEPGIKHVVHGVPHISLLPYVQKTGRGTRPLSGVVDGPSTVEGRKMAIAASDKPLCMIWDFCGNVGRHQLCRVVDVLGGKYPSEVVQRARKNIDKDGKPANIESELKKAEREIEHRRQQQQESERLSKLRIKSSYEVGECVTVSDVLNGFGMTPCWEPPWLKGKYATDAQRGLLMKFGVAVPPDMSLAQATQLINELMRRRKEVSPKVRNILVRRGLWRDDMSKSQAMKIVGQIAEQEGWRKRKAEVG
jgi:superfamily II DNA or RNA helicase